MKAVSEALRMFRRARRVKRTGFKKYSGKPEEICRAIIDDCYDGHFRVSAGHFCEFYTRDFALCCKALMELGYEDEVGQTIKYAVGAFEKAGRVTVMITPDGVPYDWPYRGPDTLAFFLHTLVTTDTVKLAKKEFLQDQVNRFVEHFMDEDMLPQPGRFTSMRDHAKRDRSCYDMVMVCLVAKHCEALGLEFPWPAEKVKEKLVSEYWNGTYFFSDMRKQGIVTGDANVMPFWTGVVTDGKMREQALTAIRAAGLDEPFPLRYVSSIDKASERVRYHPASWFVPDYQTDSIWAHLGLAYLDVLMEHDRKRAEELLGRYTKKLLSHRTFLEVYRRDGTPYETPFYVTDEAMLWCSMYLALIR